MINYHTGDFLIRIKNAAMAGLKEVSMPETKSIKTVANALKKAGYLEDVATIDKNIVVKLSMMNKKPILSDLKIVSKPGLRVYIEVRDLEKRRKPSIYLISTSKGILSSREAIKQRVGGEIIAEVL